MKKVFWVAVVFYLLTIGYCYAGWERTYGDEYQDYATCVAQTVGGGYIICGYKYQSGEPGHTMLLIKTDADGDTMWTRNFDWAFDLSASSVVQTFDKGYIVAGYTWLRSDSGRDLCIIKTDRFGDTLWTKALGGVLRDLAMSVIQTFDSGYVAVGHTESFGSGADDIWVVRFNKFGDTLWTRAFGGSSPDLGYSVVQSAEGDFYVVGATNHSGIFRDIWLLKVSSFGDTVWTKTYRVGRYYNIGLSIIQSIDGCFVISGVSGCRSFTYGGVTSDWYDGDVFLLKVDMDGEVIWTNTFGHLSDDAGLSVVEAADGGYVVCGFGYFNHEDLHDVYLVKTNSYGELLWTRTYGGISRDIGSHIACTKDGGYIITGYTSSFSESNYDVYLIKVDSLGFTGIEDIDKPKPLNWSLRTYPNPFNDAISIEINFVSAISNSLLQMGIYDIKGRLVYSAAETGGIDGTHCLASRSSLIMMQWVPSELISSGVYFVRIYVSGEKVASTKILYLK